MRQWRRLETRDKTRKQSPKTRQAVEAERSQAEAERQALRTAVFQQLWARRKESEEAYAAYEDFAQRFWADAGWRTGHIDFWRQYGRMKDGHPVDTDALIRYLEQDAWEHRSGYAKADSIAYLRRQDLSEEQKERLRATVIEAVSRHDRREFRAYCRLARKVDTPALRERLESLARSFPSDVRRRAGWVLQSLKDMDEGR